MQTNSQTNSSTPSFKPAAIDNLSELVALLGTPKTLTIGGLDIAIRQIKMGALPDVLRAVQPLAFLFNQPQQLDIASIFMMSGDDCLTLIAALSGQPRSWIDTLELDEGIQLFAALLEVNLDFFIRQVQPLLLRETGRLTQKIQAMSGQTATAG